MRWLLSFRRLSLVAVAIVLIAASLLKLDGVSVSPYPQHGLLNAPWLQMLTIDWELVLGLWLLSGLRPAAARLAGISTFTLFAIISTTISIYGQSSCNCFGAIEVSPWFALVLDFVCLGLLLPRPPAQHSITSDLAGMRRGLSHSLLWTCVGLAVVAAGLWAEFGSLSALSARLRGESLLYPATVDFGEGEPGQKLAQQVEFRNISNSPVRVIGGTTGCGLVTTRQLPITIQPGETGSFTVHMVAGDSCGLMDRYFVVWTDSPKQRSVTILAHCHVR